MEGLTALFIHSANRGYRQTESRLPVGERSTRSMSLRFLLVVLLVLVLDWVGCLRGRGRARGGLGSWSQCTAARPRGLSINRRVLPASCRQTHRRNALPARCRQYLGGAVSPVGGSLPQCMRESERGLSMIKPTSDPSQQRSERSSARCRFPYWEGLRVGHGPNAR